MENYSVVKTARNYGIDLLRIVCMFFVLTIHITGPILENTTDISYWVIFLIKMFCICAVNCYAIISGYVGVDSKKRISSLINLWFTVMFYTSTIAVVLYFASPGIIEFEDLIKGFFPVSSVQYWYFSSYFLLFF